MNPRTLKLAAIILAVFAAGWFGSQITYDQGATLIASESGLADDKKKAKACKPGEACPHDEVSGKEFQAKVEISTASLACASTSSCTYPGTQTSAAVKKHNLSEDEQKVFSYMMHELSLIHI